MKKINSKGFTVIETLLILVVAAIVGGAGWYVFQTKNKANSSYDNADKALTGAKPTAQTESSKVFTLDTKSLPAAWKIRVDNPNQLDVGNDSTGCSIDFSKTSDSSIKASDAKTRTAKYNSITVAGIKSKNYTVNELTPSKVLIATNKGQQELTTQELDLSGGDGTPTSQSYAYFVNDGYEIHLQRSCNKRSDLASTEQVLVLIKVAE